MLYTEILNDNKDFLTLYKKGRYAASKYSVIYVRPNGRPFNRLGITAGKRSAMPSAATELKGLYAWLTGMRRYLSLWA